MKVLMFLIILIVSAAGFVNEVNACVPVVEMIQDYRWEPPGPISVCVLPDGVARTFTFPGHEVNAVLHFRVEDWENTHPILPFLWNGWMVAQRASAYPTKSKYPAIRKAG